MILLDDPLIGFKIVLKSDPKIIIKTICYERNFFKHAHRKISNYVVSSVE